MNHVFEVVFEFDSYFVSVIIFANLKFNVLVFVIECLEAPVVVNIPSSGDPSDDNRLTGPLIFINEALDWQFININSVDLVGTVKQLSGRIGPKESPSMPLRPFQICPIFLFGVCNLFWSILRHVSMRKAIWRQAELFSVLSWLQPLTCPQLHSTIIIILLMFTQLMRRVPSQINRFFFSGFNRFNKPNKPNK